MEWELGGKHVTVFHFHNQIRFLAEETKNIRITSGVIYDLRYLEQRNLSFLKNILVS